MKNLLPLVGMRLFASLRMTNIQTRKDQSGITRALDDQMPLKTYVLDLRYEFAFMSEMTEIVMQEFLKAGLITPEQMTVVKAN